MPNRVEEFAQTMNRAADACGAGAIIINAELSDSEGPMWRHRDEDAAARMVEGLRESGLPLALVSHGYASPALPWKALAKCDVGMPEAYDRTRKYPVKAGKTFVERCCAKYAKHFDTVVPCLGATKTSAANMRLLHEDIGDAPHPGVVWWAWTGLRDNRDKRRAIRDA